MIGGWLMSIAGVAALGVLLDIIIPEGQTSKYVRGIFAIFTVFVIVSPLPALLNSIPAEDTAGKSKEYEANKEFIEYIASLEKTMLEKELAADIETATGYKNTVYIKAAGSEIILIEIIFDKSIIIAESEHSNIIDKARNSVLKKISIEKERIEIVWNKKS